MFSNFLRRISRSMSRNFPSYEETLHQFEKLLLFKIPKEQRPKDVRQQSNVYAMQNYLERLELDVRTKGKGSTSSFVESILQAQGLKTGLFTSPHLIDIRERIKLNGDPVGKDQFIETFWNIFNRLEESKNDLYPSMATYFRILTVMAFQIFLQEEVDVAILEVGLGGRLDATNVVHPVVCGITHIGYDHMEILGNTLPEIASEKAGIIKEKIPIITYDQIGEGVLEVFEKKAAGMDSPIFAAPNYSQLFEIQKSDVSDLIDLQMLGEHQKRNAALALTLSDVFMRKVSGEKKSISMEFDSIEAIPINTGYNGKIENYPPFPFNDSVVKGLNNTRLEGRGHVVHFPERNLSFYLDGAHTIHSVEICQKWFFQTIKKEILPKGWTMKLNGDKSKFSKFKQMFHGKEKCKNIEEEVLKKENVLVFNYTGGRVPEKLLDPLLQHFESFDHVFFVPLDSSKENLRVPGNNVFKKEMSDIEEIQIKKLVETWKKLSPGSNCGHFKSINDLLGWLWQRDDRHTSVLVTGSLYLVGDVLFKLSSLK